MDICREHPTSYSDSPVAARLSPQISSCGEPSLAEEIGPVTDSDLVKERSETNPTENRVCEIGGRSLSEKRGVSAKTEGELVISPRRAPV